ncbi:MAG: hydroxymyristoyl-ACP dehydratase [Bacteroidales bacterium]|nr:hydroxymyristoyl-ACP dehydratase [Bacteroidales bacterium]
MYRDILEYIPQRPPFVMVDKIIDSEEDSLTTQFKIIPSNYFYKRNNFQAPGLVENMAQTAAAYAGYQAIEKNERVRKGFIGSVKGLEINGLPVEGDVLQSQVKVISQLMNATVVEAKVSCNGNDIAKCQLNIFLEE